MLRRSSACSSHQRAAIASGDKRVKPAGDWTETGRTKETCLDVDEVALGVLLQLVHHSVDNVVDLREEVLVDGDLPAGVVVCVRNKVHVDFPLHNAVFFISRVVAAVGRVWIWCRPAGPRVLVPPPGRRVGGEREGAEQAEHTRWR